jgi:hypothetical protein
MYSFIPHEMAVSVGEAEDGQISHHPLTHSVVQTEILQIFLTRCPSMPTSSFTLHEMVASVGLAEDGQYLIILRLSRSSKLR